MQVDADTIFKAALQRPESDRAVLIGRLLEATPETPLTLSLDDPNLSVELDRRFGDQEKPVPWTELDAEGP